MITEDDFNSLEKIKMEGEIEQEKDYIEPLKKLSSTDKLNLLLKYDVFPDKKTIIRKSKGGDVEQLLELCGKLNIYGVAQLLLKETNYDFFKQSENDTIWRYNNGYFSSDGYNVINDLSQYLLGINATGYVRNEVLGHIRATKYLDIQSFIPPEGIINLNNCVFDLINKKNLPHSPSYKFLNKIPINYNENAKCPKIIKFIEETVTNPEDIPVIQEWFGFNLYPRYFLRKALLLVGVANTGKSVLLNILHSLVGEKNVSDVTLQDLCDNRFSKALLHQKLSNIHADLNSNSFAQTGVFKSLTGNDSITAEYKFINGFSFRNYAKLSFSCNKIPYCDDMTDSFTERWIIIECVNVHKPEDKDTNPDILTELLTKEELEGLLVWSIKGLIRLRQKHNFSKHFGWLDFANYTSKNPIQEFIDEKISSDLNNSVYKKDVYNSFCCFCNDKKYVKMNDNIFSRLLNKKIKFIHFSSTFKKKPIWKGIKLRDVDGIKVSDDRLKTKEETKLLSVETNRKEFKIREKYGF